MRVVWGPGPEETEESQRIGAAEARWAHNPKVLRSKLRFAMLSRLAQLVERKTLNLVVVGSSPTVGVCDCFFFPPVGGRILVCRVSAPPRHVPPSSVGRAQDS